MEWKRWTAAGLIALATSGCSTVGRYRDITLENKSYDYRGGTATRVYQTNAETVAKTKEAMTDVGIHSVKESHEGEMVVLEGRTADARRASVSVNAQGSRTMVSARIGLVGDEALSRALLDRLAVQLGDAGEPVIATDGSMDDPRKPKRPIISRDGVSDSFMLRNQADAGYRDSPVP